MPASGGGPWASGAAGWLWCGEGHRAQPLLSQETAVEAPLSCSFPEPPGMALPPEPAIIPALLAAMLWLSSVSGALLTRVSVQRVT